MSRDTGVTQVGWTALAAAVLARAIADLDPSMGSGFSACHASELPRWRRDAELFFDQKRFLLWATVAGYSAREVEAAYLRRSMQAEPISESERLREVRRER